MWTAAAARLIPLLAAGAASDVCSHCNTHTGHDLVLLQAAPAFMIDGPHQARKVLPSGHAGLIALSSQAGSDPSTDGPGEDWEDKFQPVDGGVNRVCRGANLTDNPPDAYVVHVSVPSLATCKRLCVDAPVCKGIEFSELDSGGRCEIWTRATGVGATAPVSGFTCLRYGAVAEKFDLINGAASDRVCRGDGPDDNSEAYYTLHRRVPSLKGCKDLCRETPGCRGIEHSPVLDGGRCEVWTRHAGIGTTLPVQGFTCLRYGDQENFRPLDGGENRVCRGASSADNSPDYFALHRNTASLEACKRLCEEAPVCKGVEYHSQRDGGRCEVWTRQAGIGSTAPGAGSHCLTFGSATDGFALADGGTGRACRGADPEDDSHVHYVLHVNISTLSACKELCMHAPVCRGVEHSPLHDGGRCEVWIRSGGVGATVARADSTCLRYGYSQEYFEPADGGVGRACRASGPDDNSPRYYDLRTEVASLSECRALCINAPACRGIEYIAESRRCEIWILPDGIRATTAMSGSTCLRYQPIPRFEVKDGGQGRACRGTSQADDSKSYYVLHTGVPTLADCRGLCLSTPECRGLEFSEVFDGGRCEVWTRPGGISATVPRPGSTCLTYGTAVDQQFHPVDGGTNRVCRGAEADDSGYVLHTGTPSLTTCKALCVDTPACTGVEYDPALDGGRCEVWTATEGILATKPHPGATCLSFGAVEGQFEPLDGGVGRACRGADLEDDESSHYVLFPSVATLQDCQKLCRLTTGCKGVEYNQGGRCEVWTRLGGIRATAPAPVFGSTCLRYGTAEPFSPVDGGDGRACRGSGGADQGTYVLHRGVGSLDECKALCRYAPVCKGVEYSRAYDDGRCEVWTDSISVTVRSSSSECLRYGVAQLFTPLGNVTGEACRGMNETDDSPSYYVLHLGTPSLGECKSLCIDTESCYGIEYSEELDGGRCEVWTRPGGIQASRPAQESRCFRYGSLPMDVPHPAM